MSARFFYIMVLCGLLLAPVGCNRHEEPKEQKTVLPARDVRVATVLEQQIIQENEVMGTVAAVERATISARVGGVIKELPVELGRIVKKGDVLAKIGADEIAARLSQAEARLEQAKRNMEREKRLLEKNAATPAGVKDLEEAVQVAEAGYREAKTMFGYTTVTAPFSGLVAQKLANAGDLAAPGTPILVLENNSSLQILVEVPEAFAHQIQLDQELPIAVPVADYSGQGQVAEIAPMADPLSRTATVKINIKSASRLRPGQFARVTLTGSASAALLVPQSALRRFGQMEQVFVVQEKVAHLRLVRTGEQNGAMVEVLSGLSSGEKIVVQGIENLLDGQTVRMVP